MPRAARTALVLILILAGALASARPAIAADPVVAAVGDMGCSTTDPNYRAGLGTATLCRQRYVSDLLVGMAPSALLDLGDNQYDNGGLANFENVYGPTFGRLNAVVYPSLGNAEYGTANAQGFVDYFSQAGVLSRIKAGGDSLHIASGYYSFDIGAWHAIALNSNCSFVGGCGYGSPQEQWLRADLAAHPHRCTLAYWHHPRWNSGTLGNDGTTSVFWSDLYNAHADLVLNGHGNHHYERFTLQDPHGVPDPAGIREFIVSTGGQHLGTPPTTPGDTHTSEVRGYTSFGALRLILHPNGYDFSFLPAGGTTPPPPAGSRFTDSGSGSCHSAAVAPPNAPSLTATARDGSVHLSWTTPPDGGSPLTGYRIYRGTATGAETLLASVGAVNAYDDMAASNGTKYFYRVAAMNGAGTGPQSPEVSATPGATPPPFPSTPILDSFARAAGPLGANWQTPGLQDAGTASIESNGVTASGSGASSATWTAQSFGADQEAYLTVPRLPASGHWVQLAARQSTTTGTNVSCYFLRVTPSSSTWELRKKLAGGSSTVVKSFTSSFAAGDGFGLRLAGSSLTAYRQSAGAWRPVGSATDAGISAAGYVSFTLGDTIARGGAIGGGTTG